MSAGPIEFWFDFRSGYAYFAAFEIDALGERHGREVQWRPYLLGVALERMGVRGLSSTPMKGDYARLDWQRLARSTGHRFAPPEGHPVVSLPVSRSYYWVESKHPEVAHDYARDLFHAYYAEGAELTAPAEVAEIAARHGVDGAALEAAVATDEVKRVLKERTEEAIGKNVFGSPFFLVDGEPFWGHDRLPMLERWLETGGW